MRRNTSLAVAALVLSALIQALPVAQSRQGAGPSYTPPRTPWGHPDISGIFTNRDEANTPLERPDAFKGRSSADFSAADLEKLSKERQAIAAKIAGGIGGAETGAGPTHWYEHLKGASSRGWFIIDPPDGKLPAMTPQAMKREAEYAALNNARNGEGRADSWLDRSLYDPLAEILASRRGQPMIDRTALTGHFDIELTYWPEGSIDAAGPLLAEALRDQLGLRLIPQRAPVDVLVIDRVQRPTDN